MKISNVKVTRIKMPRADPTWRTASYAGNAVEGFLLQIHTDSVTGLGGTAAHPRNISGDELEGPAQGTHSVRSTWRRSIIRKRDSRNYSESQCPFARLYRCRPSSLRCDRKARQPPVLCAVGWSGSSSR